MKKLSLNEMAAVNGGLMHPTGNSYVDCMRSKAIIAFNPWLVGFYLASNIIYCAVIT